MPASPVGGALHFADLDIDTSTPAGEMAANIIISGSQYERRLISQRTRDALAAKRARGERLGARPALPVEVTRRILTERAEGRTFQAIADGLVADGIPTARGKPRWYPATIKAVVGSDNATALVGAPGWDQGGTAVVLSAGAHHPAGSHRSPGRTPAPA